MLFSSFWGSLKASFVTTETPRRGSRWCGEMGKDTHKKKKKKKRKKNEIKENRRKPRGKCQGSKEKEMREGENQGKNAKGAKKKR